MEIIYWILGVLLFIIVISISVGLHEASHMWTAKFFKLKVDKFFIGFGKTLWSYKGKNTEYGVKAIPLGGFVQIQDSNLKTKENPTPEEEEIEKLDKEFLSRVSPWKRLIIFSSGAMMNLFLGTVILILYFLIFPVTVQGNTIDKVNDCTGNNICNAYTAGVLPGDEIISINGETNFPEAYENIKNNNPLLLKIKRGTDTIVVNTESVDGMIGVSILLEDKHLNLVEATSEVKTIFINNLESIASLPSKVAETFPIIFGGERNEESLTSVVSMGKLYGDVASADNEQVSPINKIKVFVIYAGLINIALGLVNLLPILPLDGGRNFIAIIDSIRMGYARLTKVFKKPVDYKPLPYKHIETLTVLNSLVVFSFMTLIILADITSPVDFF